MRRDLPFNRALTLHSGLLLGALLLPLIAASASLLVAAGPAWLTMPSPVRAPFSQDALLYIAGAALVAAPLAGIAVAGALRRHHVPAGRAALQASWILASTVAVFVSTSVLLMIFLFGRVDAQSLEIVAASHATMFAVSFALAAFGALCGMLWSDSLDAAACSIVIVIAATGALLVTGTSFADMPPRVIDVAVTTSPLVTIAAAAHIDVARMTVPYQMSPLAHLQVQYLSWYGASSCYLAFAAVCLSGVSLKVGRGRMTAQ